MQRVLGGFTEEAAFGEHLERAVSRWTGMGGAPSPPRRPSWILQAVGGGVRGLMVSEQ